MKKRLLAILLTGMLGLNMLTACNGFFSREDGQVSAVEDDDDDEEEDDEESGTHHNVPQPPVDPAQDPYRIENGVRFDGLYCHITFDEEYGVMQNKVFLFYPDGTVIDATIEQTEESSGYFPHASWFSKDNADFAGSTGTYEMSDGIVFSTVSEYGSVDYRGEVYNGYLILDSHSNINGHETQDVRYDFYPFSEIEGWYD